MSDHSTASQPHLQTERVVIPSDFYIAHVTTLHHVGESTMTGPTVKVQTLEPAELDELEHRMRTDLVLFAACVDVQLKEIEERRKALALEMLPGLVEAA